MKHAILGAGAVGGLVEQHLPTRAITLRFSFVREHTRSIPECSA